MTGRASTLDSVRRLAPAIREHADSIEQERRLPEPVVRGLVDAGVFRMPTNYEVAGQLFLGAEMSATGWNIDNRGDAS